MSTARASATCCARHPPPRRTWLLVALLALACSRGGTTWLGTEALEAAGGSAPTAGGGMLGTTSGGSAGARGGASLPARFQEPLLIAPLASAATDDDPSLTSDLLELYFSSDRDGNVDIWVSTRATPDSPWGQPAPVPLINTAFIDATPGIAPDGLTIWFESSRLAEISDLAFTDIFESRRVSRGEPWSSPVPVEELNTTGRDSAPSPSTALLMTFSSWREETIGDTDIYTTLRVSETEPWGAPGRLVEASSSSWDQGLLRDEARQIFISSARPSNADGGNFFWSVRPASSAPFLEPVPLDDLNSDAEDEDIWVSEDLSYAVFASSRSGNHEIYEAFRRL